MRVSRARKMGIMRSELVQSYAEAYLPSRPRVSKILSDQKATTTGAGDAQLSPPCSTLYSELIDVSCNVNAPG